MAEQGRCALSGYDRNQSQGDKMKRMIFLCCALALAPSSVLAKGPVGVGELKIGMKKSEVEALGSANQVQLASALSAHEYKYGSTPTPGEDKFDTTLRVPFSNHPLEAILTFSQDNLVNIWIDLDAKSANFDTVKEQVSSKYGAPETKDTTTEEQCVYRNGANFKLPSGTISHTWVEANPDKSKIETRLTSVSMSVCPSNLRYGSTEPIKVSSLSIGPVRAEVSKAAPNAF